MLGAVTSTLPHVAWINTVTRASSLTRGQVHSVTGTWRACRSSSQVIAKREQSHTLITGVLRRERGGGDYLFGHATETGGRLIQTANLAALSFGMMTTTSVPDCSREVHKHSELPRKREREGEWSQLYKLWHRPQPHSGAK